MSLAGKKRRRRTEIRQKRKRRVKLGKLVVRLKTAKSESDRTALTAKIHKVAPLYQIPK